MPFQSSVNVYQTPGIAGDFFDDSPRRVTGMIASGGVVGKVATYVSENTDPMQVTAGGSGSFAGIFVNGKELLRNSGLSAGLAIRDNSIAPVCDFGHIWVQVANDVVVNNVAAYDSAGAIYGYADSATATSGGKLVIPNATFKFFNATSGTMAVVELGK